MKERYAFRYNEYLQQQAQKGKVFALDGTGGNALFNDIAARLQGKAFVSGISSFSKLGIQCDGDFQDSDEIIPLADIYGADAVRLALVEGLPLTDENLTGCWRFIGNLWYDLKTNLRTAELCDKAVYKSLQQSNYKQALIDLKTLIKTKHYTEDILCLSYPFMPHLALYFDKDIHQKMKGFYASLQSKIINNKYFIQVNGKCVMDFYPTNTEKEQIIREALSFSKIACKIKNKSVQNVIFIPNKGVNFVVK